jgi:uncharacterized protein
MKTKFALFIGVFLLLNVYVGWHALMFLRHTVGMPSAALFWIVFFVIAFSFVLARFKVLPHPIRKTLKVIGSYYFAVFEFAVVLLPLADIAAVIAHAAGIAADTSIRSIGAAVLLVLAVLLVRGSWNAWVPTVRSHDLIVAKNAGSRNSLKVAAASDIHLGDIVGNRHLQKLIDYVEKSKPDLVLLPGDVIDDDIAPFIRHNMADVMKKLRAPLGVYAVLGNHEYYGGHIEEYVTRMESLGIRVLRDEVVNIRDDFYVAGRKDKAAEHFDPAKRMPVDALLSDTDRSKPILLLDHQPHGFKQSADAGADVLLCGHTHRGQFFPNHFITRRLFELDWGYMRKGAMHVIVSSGFGTWGPPIRLYSRSEIIELNIRFEP